MLADLVTLLFASVVPVLVKLDIGRLGLALVLLWITPVRRHTKLDVKSFKSWVAP